MLGLSLGGAFGVLVVLASYMYRLIALQMCAGIDSYLQTCNVVSFVTFLHPPTLSALYYMHGSTAGFIDFVHRESVYKRQGGYATNVAVY